MSHELSILDIDGVKYYVDTRLEEFRRVDNPHDVFPFCSERGQEIINDFFDVLINMM